MSRNSIARAAFVLVLIVMAGAAPSAEPLALDIPELPIGEALNEFGRQSGLHVVMDAGLAAGMTSEKLRGRYTAQDALDRLLTNTGLTYEYLDPQTVAVVAKGIGERKTTASGNYGGDAAGSGAHLAQAGSADPSSPGSVGDSSREPRPESWESTDSELAEIVVTASKRIERLQDVPSSVTALATQDLSENGKVRMEDFSALIPSLTVSNQSINGGKNQVALRGISTGNAGTPTVGIYIDDVPFTASTQLAQGNQIPDIDPADLERIEVLRGPQGTLYGGGSMGGLIKYVTKAPNFDAVSGRVEVNGSSVGHGGEGHAVRGSVNVPVGDRVAIRASGFDRRDPGFIDNALTGQRDWNAVDQYGGRLAIGMRLSDHFTARLTAYMERSDAQGNRGIDILAVTTLPPPDPDLVLQPLNPDLVTRRAPGSEFTDNKNRVFDLRVEGNIGETQLVSATSYGEQKASNGFDFSPVFGPGVDSNFLTVGAGAGVAIPGISTTYKFTQEIRVSSPSEKVFAWQLGAVYTHENSKSSQNVVAFDGATGGPLPVVLPDDLGTFGNASTFEESALFGDVTYRFTPKLDVTVGARYSDNSQDGLNTTSGAFFGPAAIPLSSEGDSTTFLVNPRYRFNDNLMGYVRVASGYRPGGPNAAVGGAPASYEADTTVNYEVGLKGDLMDGRFSFDVDAFYIMWRKVQLSAVSSVNTVFIFNGREAHSQGLESSVSYRPVRGLTVTGNVAYIDAQLDNDLTGQGVGFSGDRLPDSAKWAGLIGMDYQFVLSADWTGSLGAGYRYVGDRRGAFEANRYTMPSYNSVDLRAGIRNDRYSINLFATNLEDERAYLSTFLMGPVRRVTVSTPRTIGLVLSANF